MVSWMFIRNKSATKLDSDKVDDDIEQHFHLPSNDITLDLVFGIAWNWLLYTMYHPPA